jgi:hypothetical protein
VAKAIPVPRTPKSAYNPKRKVSDLLKAHITNLEAVTGYGTAAGAKRKPKNEAQASAYISEMTRQLHPALYASTAPPAPTPAGVPSAPAVSLAVPAAPARRRRRTARKKKTPARPKTARAVRRRTGKNAGKTRKPRKAKKPRKTTGKPSRY